MPDLRLLVWPFLASEPTTSGEAVPLPGGMVGVYGALPAMLATDPDFMVRVVRPVGHPSGPMTVTAEIIPLTDPEAPRTFDESHLHEANALGRFSFSTFRDDGWDIEDGDLVEFYDRGTLIGGGVIRAHATHHVGQGIVDGNAVVVWSGVRPMGALEEAPIQPLRGEGSIAQDRLWGWVGITYDDSSWIPATVVTPYGSGSWVGSHWEDDDAWDGFGDPDAFVVWAARRAGNPPLLEWSPGGETLYRQKGPVPAGVSEALIEWGGDAIAELYFEGEPQGVAYYDSMQSVRVPVVAGSEVLVAVAATNNIDPEGDQVHNPGGVIWSVRAIDPVTGEAGAVIMHSDSTAVMLEYPTSRPGVTPGLVMLEVLNEVHSFGYIPWVQATFTAEVDSYGRPWAEVGEIATKIGYNFWQLVDRLIAVYIDSELDPATNLWHAWSKNTRGHDTSVVYATDPDPDVSNVVDHTERRTLMRGNTIWSYSRFGWRQHSTWDGSSRRVAATLGLGALPSLQEVNRWGAAQVAESNEDGVEHDVRILPAGDYDKPYWSFTVADRVTIAGELQPVQTIGWRRDRAGVIWWDEDETPPPGLQEPAQ